MRIRTVPRRHPRVVRGERAVAWKNVARSRPDGERFRLLAENARDVIYRYRFVPTPGFDYVSPSSTAMTGYTPEEHYADPQLGFKLVHPEDRHLLEALLGGTEKPVVLRWLRKDGRQVWTEQRNKPVYGRSGDLVAIEGIARDVTESRRAEEALRESETLARFTMDSLSARIAILDSSGGIVAVNRAWTDSAGDAPGAGARGVGANYLEICDSATGRGAREAALFARGVRGVISGRETYFEMEYPCHSPAGRRWFVGRVTPFPGEGEPRVVVAHEETTERKVAEEATRQSEERFRAIFEQAAVGVAQVAPDGRWIKVNEKLCGITGYSGGELLGLASQDITHPDDLDADLDHRRRLEAGERETYAVEKRYRRKDGSVVWVDLTVSVVRGSSGEPAYFIFVVEDISARKKAEDALRESEERLRLALEAASLGLWYQDLETDEFVAPPETAVMHGLPPGTPLDPEQALAAVHPEDRDRVAALLGRAIATNGSYEAEYRVVRPDGTVRWMTSRARVYPDGGRRLIGVVQDITRRKQAERSLRLQAQLLDQVQAAVIATDMGGTVIEWNRHAAKLYGWTREETLGRNILDLTVGPADAGIAREILSKLQRRQPWEGEFTTRRKDGSTFPAYVVDALAYEENGRPIGVIGVSVDISARRTAEDALRESEERFRAAFDSTAVGMALCSPEGRWLRVNRSLCEITGYTEEELLDTDFQSITHPDDVETDLEGARRLLAGEIRYHRAEKRYVHKDGHPVWLSLSVALVRDAGGKPLYFVVQAQDVTQGKKDKENLQKLGRQNEMILASAGEGIYGLDLRERTTFANPAAEEMLGYEPGELMGRHQHAIIHHAAADGATYPEDDCPVYAALRDGNVHVSSDEVFRRKDGTNFPVEYTSTPIFEEDEVVGAVVTFSDITERKRAEESLRRSEERFRLLAENTNDLVCLHEPDGRYLYLSPSCRRLLGYEPKDLLGADPYGLFHPEDLERIRRESHEAALEGKAAVSIIFRIRKASGEYVWFETLTQPILDEDGAVIRLQTSSRDVSERKRAEEAVAEAARAKTEFLAEVSHELRTPLTVIRGNAEVGLDLDRDCEHGEILHEIVRESSTMSRMVEELLFLARSGSATPPFEMAPVAAKTLLSSLARRAAGVAAGHDATLAVSPAGDGLVRADPARVEQAILAVVENAAKYGPRGQTITIDSATEGGELRVEVSDQGPGIPEADLPHVFERFYRASNAGEPGNGLGLSIARTIVEAHNGRIEVKSEAGRGTQVRVSLPLLRTSG